MGKATAIAGAISAAQFKRLCGAEPHLFRAPGRVNLIGEHTDYNQGFVLPAAIDKAIYLAIGRREDSEIHLFSIDLDQDFTCTLDLPEPSAEHWPNYLLGVVQQLQQAGRKPGGFNCVFTGDIPLGAGMSSSAALECATAFALNELFSLGLDKLTMVRLSQRAENDYVGVQCGIMDQFASACGRAGHALWIDCRSLEHRLLPLDQSLAGSASPMQLVICNTMVRHGLASSQYNRRRDECELGVQALSRIIPGIETLRDVSSEVLRSHAAQLDPSIYRRCRHLRPKTNASTPPPPRSVRADLTEFGRLMRESHQSLRDDYEVSCDELDLMVRIAEQIDGVYGARMTGGGFGGCTVNVVRTDAVARFRSLIAQRYAQASGHAPEIYVCEAADGAARIEN